VKSTNSSIGVTINGMESNPAQVGNHVDTK
jgi:hypothetical protein